MQSELPFPAELKSRAESRECRKEPEDEANPPCPSKGLNYSDLGAGWMQSPAQSCAMGFFASN